MPPSRRLLLLAAAAASADAFAARVGVAYSPAVLGHRPPGGRYHPECPERVSSIHDHLKGGGMDLDWVEPALDGASEDMRRVREIIDEVHWDEYLKELRMRCERGGGQLDEDTYLGPESYESVVAGTACWVEAVRRTVERRAGPTFALARPPGHHAPRSQGMGFCLINHCAVAARYALKYCEGVERVAIFDWDVHHGNGVESLFRREPNVCYASIHQANAFPFSGEASDRGMLKNLLNVPVAEGSDWAVYEDKVDNAVMPFLSEFNPDLVIISAGYDALDDDEMAGCALQPADYGKLMDKFVAAFGSDKIVLGLEGGYNLEVTPKAVEATLAKL